MQKCPNCGEETISNWSKFMSGPARVIKCSNCNASVSISWYTFFCMMGIIAGVSVFRDKIDEIMYMCLFIFAMFVYTYIHYKFIPLRVRKGRE